MKSSDLSILGVACALLLVVIILSNSVMRNSGLLLEMTARERDQMGQALNATQQQLTLTQSELAAVRIVASQHMSVRRPDPQRRRVPLFDTSFRTFR